jgi:serralysin
MCISDTSYLDSYAYFEEGVGTSTQGLAVYNVNGSDVKWTAAQARQLTYCVSQSSFGSRYQAVVDAMDRATAAWSAAEPNVQYQHLAAEDASCTSRNNNVLFNVRQVKSSRYLARAFFPSSSRRGREILVSSSSFGNISPWTLVGVLTHELGHTIGFRHEHTRPEAGTCYEDSSWRALTAYDSSSVMHYPQCNGTQKGDLVITQLDAQGVSALY